jgi:hypothetical protein
VSKRSASSLSCAQVRLFRRGVPHGPGYRGNEIIVKDVRHDVLRVQLFVGKGGTAGTARPDT